MRVRRARRMSELGIFQPTVDSLSGNNDPLKRFAVSGNPLLVRPGGSLSNGGAGTFGEKIW